MPARCATKSGEREPASWSTGARVSWSTRTDVDRREEAAPVSRNGAGHRRSPAALSSGRGRPPWAPAAASGEREREGERGREEEKGETEVRGRRGTVEEEEGGRRRQA